MRRFSDLYETLEQTTSTNVKVDALNAYFQAAPPADAAWAVFFLSGRRLKGVVGGARLRRWLGACSGLPEWLVEECYGAVGDLAETIALLLETETPAPQALSLSQWLEQHILPLKDRSEAEQQALVSGWWRCLERRQCYMVNKLLTGSLRVGVSRTLVVRALAQVAGLEPAVIAQRLTGDWQPSADFYQRLVSPTIEADDGDYLRPYPFFLASPLDATPTALGPREDFLVEWKWDGIRAQLMHRRGETHIWSRGEELVSERYPEILAAARELPEGTVLDGEILAWRDGVLPFAALQQRIGRKRVGKKLLADIPVIFLAYDLLEHEGCDSRSLSLRQRRKALEDLLTAHGGDLLLSQPIDPSASWETLALLRDESHARGVEGLMLKRWDSAYGTGRRKGSWWKWKVDPYTVDAVLIYAQAGHGRRASLFTDYTFAVWEGEQLVPIAKAYSGLSDAEIQQLDRWIRRNTRERFGPVRSVPAEQVFELAFESIAYSSRHKSGVALRFPRISRWRTDLGSKDADTLQQVKALIRA